MLPDRVSNLGPLTYESGALPTALRSPKRRQLKRLNQRMHSCLIPTIGLNHFEAVAFIGLHLQPCH